MAYLGSEAYRLDGLEREREQLSRPSFGVVEGGGADARVRQGVSPTFVARIKVALVVFAAFVTLGVARVAVTAATVSALANNAALERGCEEAAAANSDLRIERSILSSSARIDRIAVQNYGMVAATEHDVIALPTSVSDSDGTQDGHQAVQGESQDGTSSGTGAAPTATAVSAGD